VGLSSSFKIIVILFERGFVVEGFRVMERWCFLFLFIYACNEDVVFPGLGDSVETIGRRRAASWWLTGGDRDDFQKAGRRGDFFLVFSCVA
jgi:hypothetical protein